MKYRKLGRTDIDVSVICLGTMTWGLQNTQEEAFEQMHYALERGVTFFDTAELYAVPPSAETYGKTETIIGQWFSKHKTRDQIILASKIAGARTPWIRGGAPITPDAIDEALNGSLTRLQTDYIDLYQLHWPNRGSYAFQAHWGFDPAFDPQEEIDNMLAVLQRLDNHVKAGKIRHIGLSNETAWGTMQYLKLAEQHTLPRAVSIQNEYSLLYRLFDLDMQELARAEDIGLLAWSPLATGSISGKYLDGARPSGSRWSLSPGKNARDSEKAQTAIRRYAALADTHGLDVCQMALAFVHERPFVTSTIIGATSMDQLKSNIASIDLNLSPEILAQIEVIHRDCPWVY